LPTLISTVHTNAFIVYVHRLPPCTRSGVHQASKAEEGAYNLHLYYTDGEKHGGCIYIFAHFSYCPLICMCEPPDACRSALCARGGRPILVTSAQSTCQTTCNQQGKETCQRLCRFSPKASIQKKLKTQLSASVKQPQPISTRTCPFCYM